MAWQSRESEKIPALNETMGNMGRITFLRDLHFAWKWGLTLLGLFDWKLFLPSASFLGLFIHQLNFSFLILFL